MLIKEKKEPPEKKIVISFLYDSMFYNYFYRVTIYAYPNTTDRGKEQGPSASHPAEATLSSMCVQFLVSWTARSRESNARRRCWLKQTEVNVQCQRNASFT
jgi:hypothetical protein